jgi:DME family drug/metabolite transporter
MATRYTDEFRRDAVRIAISSGLTRPQVSSDLGLLSLAEVLLGPLWVWLFLGETVSVNTLIGGVILLAAIAGNAVSGKRRKPPPITAP